MTDERDELERTHGSSGTKYILALLGLLMLTGLSFVGVVFMELRESLAATRMIALVSVAFVALLCLGIAGDVAFR